MANGQGTEREATREEIAEAIVKSARGPNLSTSTVAVLLGVSTPTLIGWLDEGLDQAENGELPKAPPCIRQPHRYVFRPAALVPWMLARGYDVPASLKARAKEET